MAMASLPSILMAQKAGDIISGVVEDNDGPLMMVNVTERDAADRIVNYDITDVEGNFSFQLKNPKDRIQVSYVGYETVDLPIDKTYFEIKMHDQSDLPPVDIVAEKVSSGPLPIPMRELTSVSTTIDMSDFEGQFMTTVDEALQGVVPGFDIVFNSGDLAARSTMHLRGVTTMTGDANPLIVVDNNIWEIESNLKNNFDYTNNSQDTEKVSELLNINPEDIASIRILRDAAATAIWGSRGSNGVMEITTKRGSRGKTRVQYSYHLNTTWQPLGYQLLNGDQYTMFLKESFFNPEMKDEASDIIELNYKPEFSEYEMYNDNTDWVAAVKQIGLQHSHTLSVGGGGDKANFHVSAGFDNQDGSVIGQKMNRFTTRVNFDYLVSQRITVSTDFSLTYNKNKTNSAAIGSAMKMMPNLAIYYEDRETGKSTGKFYHMLPSASDELPKKTTNPVAEAAEKEQYSTSLNVSNNFSIRYNLLGLENDETKLQYEGRVSFSTSNSDNDSYTPQSLDRDGWKSSSANTVSASANKNFSLTTTHSFLFVPHFRNRDHSVMMRVNGEVRTGNSKGQNGNINGLPSGFKSLGLPGNVSGMGTSANRTRSMNAYFTGHYSFRSKYSLDLTIRADGSTRFGDAKRWGAFPSLSAGWNIIDESFMKAIKRTGYLSDLNLHGSLGVTGQEPGSDSMYLSKYKSSDSYLGTSSMVPDNIRASTMQWAETTSWNLGVRMGLLNDKFSVEFEVYDRVTKKMIQTGYSIPSSSGYSSLSVANDGTMENKGWEFSVNSRRLFSTRLFGKDFNMGFNVNLADNMNKIIELNPTLLEKMTNDFDYKNGSYLAYVALNNAYGSIYGFKYKGVYQYSVWSETEVEGVSGPNAPVVRDSNGDVILIRKNGKDYTRPMKYDFYGNNYTFAGGDAIYEDINYDGNINELDIVYLGSSLPKLNGGFGVNMSLGRLTWRNQFSFRYGNRIVNASRMNAECMYNTDNTSAAINWRWRVEGDKTIMPRALHNYGYNYLGSDRYVEDGSFLRWTSSNLNYSLDPKITKKLHVSNVSCGLSMSNVMTFTKYSGVDPESAGSGGQGSVAKDNSQTPRSKQISFNVSVTF